MKTEAENTYNFPILIEQDEVYIVSCPSFQRCHSYGKTVEKALVNIRQMIEMCITYLEINSMI